jgi:hypothetical protein
LYWLYIPDRSGNFSKNVAASLVEDGTILIGAALPVVAEALQIWGLRYEQI